MCVCTHPLYWTIISLKLIFRSEIAFSEIWELLPLDFSWPYLPNFAETTVTWKIFSRITWEIEKFCSGYVTTALDRNKESDRLPQVLLVIFNLSFPCRNQCYRPLLFMTLPSPCYETQITFHPSQSLICPPLITQGKKSDSM